MLLSITTTRRPATDLGYLLHEYPDKFQRFLPVRPGRPGYGPPTRLGVFVQSGGAVGVTTWKR